jgi:hypothetical protein
MCAVMIAVSGCSPAPYNERMAFLDQMSTKGIEYRGQLQKQGTEPSEKACSIGFSLLKPDIPSDVDGGGVSQGWRDQVREAYMKSCMTGQPRPKPDPSGVKAVTPVPFGSESPSTSAASPSASSP